MSVTDLFRRLSGSLLLCGLALVVACAGEGDATERAGKREGGEQQNRHSNEQTAVEAFHGVFSGMPYWDWDFAPACRQAGRGALGVPDGIAPATIAGLSQ